VNEYKLPFILRRLLQTLLGGAKLTSADGVPVPILLLQVRSLSSSEVQNNCYAIRYIPSLNLSYCSIFVIFQKLLFKFKY